MANANLDEAAKGEVLKALKVSTSGKKLLEAKFTERLGSR